MGRCTSFASSSRKKERLAMADRQVKVVGKHSKDCWREWGSVAYGKHGEPVIITRRRYGKNGWAMRSWVRVICNNTECKAELHIERKFIPWSARRSRTGR
jgi:hypothetical protein